MMTALRSICHRDRLIIWRRYLWLGAPTLLGLTVLLIAMVQGGEVTTTQPLLPPTLWIVLQFVALLSAQSLVNEDMRDHQALRILTLPLPIFPLLLFRNQFQACLLLTPAAILATLATLSLHDGQGVSSGELLVLQATLLLLVFSFGGNALYSVANFAAGLAMGRGGLLTSIMALPICLPILVAGIDLTHLLASQQLVADLEWLVFVNIVKFVGLCGLLAVVAQIANAMILRDHLQWT